MDGTGDFIDNLERLSSSVWASAALVVAVDLGLLDRLARPTDEVELVTSCGDDPRLVEDLIEVLISLGAIEREGGRLVPTASLEMLSSPTLRRVINGKVRGDHLQTHELIARMREGQPLRGWSTEDPVALTAQGETGGTIGLVIEALLPGLDGLAERMERPGARILDVGAGVGVISADLCRLWPEAEAVGLEPHRTSRELGRSRIAAAGLSDRIALRDERVEALGEHQAYDLAFVPQPFIDPVAVAEALPRIFRALRPGGWLIVLTGDAPPGSALLRASRRFRARIWGGGLVESDRLRGELEMAGFERIRADGHLDSFRAFCACRPFVGSSTVGYSDDLLGAGAD
ncbi:MAG: class I SAM-dependent methyltransferase [Solirubrobacterales bacterium]